jgi:hypothetical protein
MKFLVFLFLSLVSAQGQKYLTATEAVSHEGENATVCGIVASEHAATRSNGQPTFINLDQPYPRQVFTVLIWGEDRRKVGALPALNSRLCATGLIENYRGSPEMIVRSATQLKR